MINDEADEVIKETFDSLKNRYQNNLESMKSSGFVFHYGHFIMYYRCHKINPNPGGSYIDSLNWLKNENATINPIIKKDNKCFQYTITIALNFEQTKKDPTRMKKLNLL